LAAFFLFFGAGLIFGILNVIYRDVGRVVNIVLRYGIFLSGVIFPLGTSAKVEFFNSINPFAVFVESARQIVFKGGLEPGLMQSLGIWTVIGIFVFFLGVRLFHVMEYRIRGVV
jgi:ABC-type polysaccharide/polyol phosphate export permease